MEKLWKFVAAQGTMCHFASCWRSLLSKQWTAREKLFPAVRRLPNCVITEHCESPTFVCMFPDIFFNIDHTHSTQPSLQLQKSGFVGVTCISLSAHIKMLHSLLSTLFRCGDLRFPSSLMSGCHDLRRKDGAEKKSQFLPRS